MAAKPFGLANGSTAIAVEPLIQGPENGIILGIMDNISRYLTSLVEKLLTGEAREHAYRPPFEELLKSIAIGRQVDKNRLKIILWTYRNSKNGRFSKN